MESSVLEFVYSLALDEEGKHFKNCRPQFPPHSLTQRLNKELHLFPFFEEDAIPDWNTAEQSAILGQETVEQSAIPPAEACGADETDFPQ